MRMNALFYINEIEETPYFNAVRYRKVRRMNNCNESHKVRYWVATNLPLCELV